MAEIKPFKALLYNPDQIPDLSRVLTPPYDVITPQMQDEYYNLSPYNIIRIILGKEFPDDAESHNKYTRAAKVFREWIDKGILNKENRECIYVYGQKFRYRQKERKRFGFTTLVKIGEPQRNEILPHEKVFSETKEDRARLLEAVKANLSPIFAIFEDPQGKVARLLRECAKKTPLVDIKLEGVRHRLCSVCDNNIIAQFQKELRDKQIFIADGHHRYEAAVQFRDKMQRQNPGSTEKKSYNFVMMYLCTLEDKGLTILSTHRLIKKLNGLTIAQLQERLKNFFRIDLLSTIKVLLGKMEAKAGGRHLFGMYCGRGQFFLLTLKDEGILDKMVAPDASPQYRRLDATILQVLILENILGLGPDEEQNIHYTREANIAMRLVDEKNYRLAFFLNPTKVTQVRDIAMALDRMPHKSTYFYPKLLTGLVMRKF